MENGMEKPMTQSARRAAATPNIARAVRAALCAGAFALVGANALAAGPNADQATRIYNRIAGIPPSAAQLAQMTGSADAVAPDKAVTPITPATRPPPSTRQVRAISIICVDPSEYPGSGARH